MKVTYTVETEDGQSLLSVFQTDTEHVSMRDDSDKYEIEMTFKEARQLIEAMTEIVD